MREYINLLNENSDLTDDEFNRFTSDLSLKIKDLPNNPQTNRALEEIEDLLTRSGAGETKLSGLEKQILPALDSDLQGPKGVALRKLLARYIFSIDMSRAEQEELFNLWKSGKLINISKLLSKKPYPLTEIVTGYGTNTGITVLTDELLKQTAYGKGKGEYFLTTFSKRIKRRRKGDVEIDGRNIEIKTADAGGARFFDRDVKPDAKWYALVNNFFKKFKHEIGIIKVPASGLSFNHLIKILQHAKTTGHERKMKIALSAIFSQLYGTDASSKIISALVTDTPDAKLCTQISADATFNRYMEAKDDEGVLFINMSVSPAIFFYFSNSNDLKNANMRLSAKHGYPITTHASYAYPQITVVAASAPDVAAAEPVQLAAPTPASVSLPTAVSTPRQGRETPATAVEVPPTDTAVNPVQAPTQELEQDNDILNTFNRLNTKY